VRIIIMSHIVHTVAALRDDALHSARRAVANARAL